MKVLRTPERYFENIKDYPFEPVYTNIETKDGTVIRIHHIDEGSKRWPYFACYAWSTCLELSLH
jgi:haloalkane dehalogenase